MAFSSLLLAAGALATAALDARFDHWFVAPVLACGLLLVDDVARWMRGECDLFDPYAIIAILGPHLFVAAPLLHVASDYWLPYITPPEDWRPWLGAMAAVDFLGLLAYRVSRELVDRFAAPMRPKSYWRLEPARFWPLAALSLAGATVLQTLAYAKFGGIGGYIEAFGEGSEQFTGMGLTFMFSESAPIVALLAAVAWVERAPRRRTLPVMLGILAGFVALKFAFGGMRGSRGHLIYGLFWAGVVLHQRCRPMSKQLLAVGAAFLLVFMYAYGFYKSFGVDALEALDGAAARADLMDHAPRGVDAVLLGDLARSDVQAFMLYRLSLDSSIAPYDYALGETYLGAVAQLVPRGVLTDRPATKVKPGTDLLFGPGVFENDMPSTFAYALAGEAILNFGVLGAVASFALVGFGAAVARRWYLGLAPGDSRSLVLPLLYSLPFMALLWDSDVLVFYVVKEGFVPAAIVALGSRRVWSALELANRSASED